jgi:ribonucleoside-diphosphate reductase alpha chain
MKITRRFTKPGQDAFSTVEYEKRTSRITNPDGTVVFEMTDAEIPKQWSQLATDIMVSKYFRKAGVPQKDSDGNLLRDEKGNVIYGPEKSARQVIHRLAGCWRHWGETHGYFDTEEDAESFYQELSYMLLHQMCAPNSPQWFNTGLNYAYGITGPSQGHFYCDPKTGQLKRSADAYTHPQPHACFIQAVTDDLVNEGGIMDLWTREARLFKYGSGTGSNFSRLRGENEPLSGGGKSSGLMSFLKIGDRAAGAIKSGGTTRRAAKMVCLDLDHPDIEDFINWKVREELKVAAMAEGIKVLPKDQQELAKRLGLKLDYDFNGEGYQTVSGQNSNNSVRIPNEFFKAVEEDADWHLYSRTTPGKIRKTIKARKLWDEICFAAWRCADPGVQYDGTINEWHTCPRSGRINASNPCVTGDTRVLTPGGIWRRIDQMIHLPSRLVTNLHGQHVAVTDGAFPTGTKEVYELRTVSGYSVKVTGDHRIWTRQRGWVEARHLTTADEIKLPSQPACVEQVGEPADHRFFQLLGLFLSQANHDSTALHLDACLPEHELVEKFAQYVSVRWGAYPDDYVNALMVDTTDLVHSEAQQSAEHEGNTLTATLTNKRLISRLRAYISKQGKDLRLSDEAFTAGLAAQKHFLRALFTADARIDRDTLELTSASRGLLEDIQLLLLGFGVKSTVWSDEATKRRSDEAINAVSSPSSLRRSVASSLSSSQAAKLIAMTSGNGGAVARGGSPDDAEGGNASSPRHGLRIDPGSLRFFYQHVSLLPGSKLEQLGAVSALPSADCQPPTAVEHWDAFATLTAMGRQQVFDLTEPTTHSFIANGLTVHNCSEYMFLDDTACNLASLNVLTFFDADGRSFDIEAYKHGIRLWTIVLEISVLMASFPSEKIAELSYRYRTLGLGYANLGAMLMQAGIPYDSEKGRALCAALTAILTGESYATSAELARELGPFPGYHENRNEMLRVMRNHRRAAYDVCNSAANRQKLGDYESLDIKPVGTDLSQFVAGDPLASPEMLRASQECWDRALALGEVHGYRNAQATVIAPTGTIGLLMDCDTTGVEPDFALVKFKKLAGGGYFKIANQSLRPALVNLGYTPEQIHDIIKYVMGSLNLDDAPHINTASLKLAGFTDADLQKIEASLPGVFELGFAFSPWTLGAETMARLGFKDEKEYQATGFNLLRELGYSRKQIDAANDYVCGRGTVEGAPHLKPEHLPVFDTANKCGKHGTRFIAVEGHIRMMAAAQPFISGAISKTINLPNEASVEDIARSYELSWKLGLKANALYRDGSKLSQPLNVKSDADLDKAEDDDEENVSAAREEVATQVAGAVASATTVSTDNLEPANIRVVEKIVERIVERPLRRRLPDTRNAMTHKFDIQGHEGYITVGLYEDGQPGEVFITMAKEGSTIGGLMDTIATLVSVSLQYGVPVESLVKKFEHVRFEPSGMTRNPEIPMAKSLVDYIFRWLAMEFIPGYRATHAPKRPEKKAASSRQSAVGSEEKPEAGAPQLADNPQSETRGSTELTRANPQSDRNGNGHKPRLGDDAGAKPFDYGSGLEQQVEQATASKELREDAARPALSGNLRLTLVADPVSQQGADMQSDAPACDVCGSITVRSGTCYKCLNCGNSMGCS